jgi:hypothetical protein
MTTMRQERDQLRADIPEAADLALAALTNHTLFLAEHDLANAPSWNAVLQAFRNFVDVSNRMGTLYTTRIKELQRERSGRG